VRSEEGSGERRVKRKGKKKERRVRWKFLTEQKKHTRFEPSCVPVGKKNERTFTPLFLPIQ
jgi:hypothetical protein